MAIRNVWMRHDPGGKRGLIVFVPGWRRKVRDYCVLLSRLMGEPQEPFSSCDFLALDYPNAWYANGDPTALAREMGSAIQDACQERHYEDVYLVGHSLGGVLLRRAILEGLKSQAPGGRNWTDAIRCLVLLASGNRGYVVRKLRYRLLVLLLWILRLARLGRSVLRETPWINNLRLGWIEAFWPGGGAPLRSRSGAWQRRRGGRQRRQHGSVPF